MSKNVYCVVTKQASKLFENIYFAGVWVKMTNHRVVPQQVGSFMSIDTILRPQKYICPVFLWTYICSVIGVQYPGVAQVLSTNFSVGAIWGGSVWGCDFLDQAGWKEEKGYVAWNAKICSFASSNSTVHNRYSW